MAMVTGDGRQYTVSELEEKLARLVEMGAGDRRAADLVRMELAERNS